ncbi:hypothetical protein NC651_032376 [Populus alba x Populus x berolinensis]|nr:hypothetical protein NC651_032376 [Populus alba x Populus x berolinensis]
MKICTFQMDIPIHAPSLLSMRSRDTSRLHSINWDHQVIGNSFSQSGEGKKALDCLCTALREYNLKFGTILNYPVFCHISMARLDGEDIGYGFHRDLKLISEVQAPSRSVTRFFYAAFSAAAGISLLFTIPRIFRVIKGGGDAPGLWETAGNAAINTGAWF